ncbi:AbrB family transcriptional regulator [Neobacillus notoginsengisoli]|uniref:AbrB family transcriptional regulator n=1 Tax=Neobacillus notoginsengisoli TaxID=1578198 RepID=A0A417YXT1_9BACI|nr:AbrB family transcriptional regulator [Neobacillus notoginsengisoli]RHW42578.1 AbrB family transcriptional regulator [Neobacillus notoginsengisoli]
MNSSSEKLKSFILTFLAALVGGLIFRLPGLPVPWLLGPMTAVLACSAYGKFQLFWPSWVRDTALIILGYSIGLSFTKEALSQIISHFPSIILMTLLLIGYCTIIAFGIAKVSGLDYRTVLIGSIPGGLSQMIALSEEVDGTDSAAVTVFQVSRLLLIIFIVPFFALSAFLRGTEAANLGKTAENTVLVPEIFLFAPLAILFAILGKKIKMPTPFLTGPILITAALTVAGIQGPVLPDAVMDISQLLMGAYIGLMFNLSKLIKQGKQLLIWAVFSSMMLLAGAAVMGILLSETNPISTITGYLSMAPGGMDQMTIIAHEAGADLSIVAGYQLFRIFFIVFAVPYLLRAMFRLMAKQHS